MGYRLPDRVSSTSRGRPEMGARNRHARRNDARLTQLIARSLGVPDLLQDLTEVVALRRLQRRELLVRLQVLKPQLLSDRQHVPVVQEGCHGSAERASQGCGGRKYVV